MKKAILLFACALISATTIAQTKTSAVYTTVDTALKKAEFVFSGTVPVGFGVTITSDQAVNFIKVLQLGGIQAIDYSDKISNLQGTTLKQNYANVMDSVTASLVKQFNLVYEAEKAKFSADTATKVIASTKFLKPKK